MVWFIWNGPYSITDTKFQMCAVDDDEPYEMEYNPSNGKITARGRAAGRDLLMATLAKRK